MEFTKKLTGTTTEAEWGSEWMMVRYCDEMDERELA